MTPDQLAYIQELGDGVREMAAAARAAFVDPDLSYKDAVTMAHITERMVERVDELLGNLEHEDADAETVALVESLLEVMEAVDEMMGEKVISTSGIKGRL